MPRSLKSGALRSEYIATAGRLLLVAVAIFTSRCASTEWGGSAGKIRLTSRFLTSHEFRFCDDLEALVCEARHAERVSFFADGSAGSTYGAFGGNWRLAQDALIVGDRFFQARDEGRYLYAPASPGLSYGTYIFLPANINRVAEAISAKSSDPARLRAMYHDRLKTRQDVHGGCIGLLTVGDWSSVPYLLEVLRHRPVSKLIDTDAICVDALKHVTGGNAGYAREDWEEWLAAHPRPEDPVKRPGQHP